MGNSRFNVNKPYNPGAPGTVRASQQQRAASSVDSALHLHALVVA